MLTISQICFFAKFSKNQQKNNNNKKQVLSFLLKYYLCNIKST